MDIVVVFNHKSALTLQSQFFTNHGPPKIENTFFAGNDWKQANTYFVNVVAIKTDGTLWVWGDNPSGQFGNGTTTPYSSPIQIGALSNWKQVNIRRCLLAIKTDGTMWSCGYNSYGGLGNGTTIFYSSPVQIGSLTNWKQISSDVVNGYFSAAIKTDGTLWSWGYNGYGNLGLDQSNAVGVFGRTNKSSPVLVAGGATWATTDPDTNIITESLGSQTVAIESDGTLWGWGQNANGELGNGTRGNYYSSPIQIGSLTNWKQVANIIGDPNVNSGQSTAAVKTDGTLWAWGSNDYGIVGNGTTVKYSSPVQVGALTNWKQISGSYYSIHAVKTDGTLWGWGLNNLGKLGNGNIINYSSPIQIGSLTTWKHVASSSSRGNAIKTDGTFWRWGNDTFGSTGSSPVQVGTATNWVQLNCGYSSTFAYASNNTLYGIGRNQYGQIGVPSSLLGNVSSPIQVGSLTNWKQVSVAGDTPYTMAIKSDGTLWTWGSNRYGNLGNGTRVYYSSPIQIGSLTNWKQVSAGSYHTAAIKTDGTLWTWGSNQAGISSTGALGNGVNGGYYSSPIQIGSLTNWKQVKAGDSSTFAVKTDGTLWAWGYNNVGQLGNGTTSYYSSPIQVGSLTIWKEVSGQLACSAIQAPDLELAKYAPGAPSYFMVSVVNSTAVSISITFPYNGNDPITSYEVSY